MMPGNDRIVLPADPNDPEDFDVTAEALEWSRRERAERRAKRNRTSEMGEELDAAAIRRLALEEAARWVDSRRDDYISDHGIYDPETGATEFPGDGEQYVGELEEIAEGIRALIDKPGAEPDVEGGR